MCIFLAIVLLQPCWVGAVTFARAPRRRQAFEVQLRMNKEERLGLLLDYCGRYLVVAEVASDGAVAKSDYDVQIGDQIIAVNGRKGNDEELMIHLQKYNADGMLSFQIQREENERIDFSDATNLAMHAQRQAAALSLEPIDTTKVDEVADVVQRQGVVKVHNVLTPQLAAELLQYVLDQETSKNEDAFSKGVFAQRVTPKAPRTRFEFRLPETVPIVQKTLRHLFIKSPLRPMLLATVGPEAKLWELSVMVSKPGAAPQIFHADTPYRSHQRLFTTFIALQDITLSMGPTSFVPSTHNDPNAHSAFAQDAVQFLSQQTNACSGIMDCGDATLYDSRLIHCGSANHSDQIRALLCLTFKSSEESESAALSTPSIRTSLLDHDLSLRDLIDDKPSSFLNSIIP